MRQYNFDPLEEIQKIVGDTSLAKILSAFEKKGLSLGQRAHLASALQTIAAALESNVRKEALDRARNENSFTDYGVEFRYKREFEQMRVNIAEVKKELPPSEEGNSKFYNKKLILDNITIKIGKPSND